MRRAASLVPRTLLAAPVSSSSFSLCSAGVRPLHSSVSLSHNHSDWPLRSAQYFRDLKVKQVAEEEAANAHAIENAQPFLRVAHPHPSPLEVLPVSAPAHFAVFRFRNEQYKAVEDDLLMVNLVNAEVGDKIIVDDVLLLGGRDVSLIGRPSIAGARVELQVEEHTYTEKKIIFKKKRRKHFKKKQGHREEVSMVRVLRIELPEGVAPLTQAATIVDATAVKIEKPTKPVEATATDASQHVISEETRLRLRAERMARRATRTPVSAAGVRAFHTSAYVAAAPAESAPTTTNEATIDSLLRRELDASALHIEDTSGGCGAFFRLLVVSPKFSGLSLVKQHRLVNETLKPHIANLHGLTLTTLTEEQWKEKQASM